MIDNSANRTMMVDTQVRPSDVTKFPIIDAMLTVRREAFVPESKRNVAYAGENIDLGNGRVVLDPRTFAKMLDALDIQRSDVVLDIGCGSGYSAAILAHMADAVVAVEEDESLASDAETALSEQGIDNAVVITGPLAKGAAKHGPYDVICIEGAVSRIPDDLVAQLKEGGRILAIFAQGAFGEARLGRSIGGRVSWSLAFNAGAPILPGFGSEPVFSL
ncbi:protein-L-isoaspartate O-methyltransferase family protein [Litoreibacter janthinus]|uniref:Protein-L-isoaspartate O-methyltransferase n=1 Tax=Litoreibacter janthinus TaxID=670154 RepID=A0A1I6HRL4_9RHOB|nr:protein-L-isoaspartate O-methyltransferase [Litoreibacter janthinus]SFR57106.1 protein-L-isoaspartate(D-aspartate) O-methyltransferase [Litoreibacter janthinus]